ncbi:hypothetical protein G6514_001906 [Epicoccum nigrum]|nr:hypothetical protein G6514_001906 [Epicoccum nigrum]
MKFNDPVRIEVGPEDNKKTLTMNSEILTTRSLFFRKALCGNFKEVKEHVVKLPEDDPEIFGIYLHHLQTNELSVVPDPVPRDYTGDEEKMKLVQLYVLAEKLQDVQTKKAIIKGLITSCYQFYFGNYYLYSSAEVTALYEGTTAGSVARKLVVDIMAWDVKTDYVYSSMAWPTEFLSDMIHEFVKYRDTNHDKKTKYWRRDHPEEYMEKETED